WPTRRSSSLSPGALAGGAEKRTRTSTGLPPPEPESGASANSAISAGSPRISAPHSGVKPNPVIAPPRPRAPSDPKSANFSYPRIRCAPPGAPRPRNGHVSHLRHGMKFASGSRIELSVLRPKKKPAEGFTLIELMVVVTIIGILAGLAGPGVGAALREMRASNARADVIRILNHARTAPRGTGKAHLLQFDGAADGNRGRLSVYRSDASSCLTTDWAAVIAASNNCDVVTGVNNRCVTRTDFQNF